MAITLLTPAAKPATPSPSSADAAASDAGGDFNSLLLGQLTPQATAATPSLPVDSMAKDQPAETLPIAAEPLQDPSAAAAQILTSLGLIKPETTEQTAQGKETLAAQTLSETPNLAPGIEPLNLRQQGVSSPEGKPLEAPLQTILPASTDTPDAPGTTARPANFAELLDGAVTTAPATLTEARDNAPTTSLQFQPTVQERPAATVRYDANLEVQTPIRDARWNQDFSQKIVWLAGNGKQTAELTLNPPQMGPIEISLNIDKGSASATFVSANADVRQSIESALPRLREMFAGVGIELGQANVSAESFRQALGGQNGDAQGQGKGQGGAERAILVGETSSLPGAQAFAGTRGRGMVDIFA